MTTAIRTTGLTKRYGPTVALNGIDFSVMPGQVCALMGRNGAGKSTLVRMLSGEEKPDSGVMFLDEQEVEFRDPDHALGSGIATVHQEIAIIPGLSVAENVTLGRWETRGGLIDRARNRRIAASALDLLGVDLLLDRAAGDLRIAEQQLVEIARALSYEPKVLILDEPTSSLTGSEAERLGHIVRRLAGQGVAIIYVSHRMDEIEKVADVVTVFRDGEVVGNRPVAEASISTIASLMAGAELEERHDRVVAERSSDVALRVSDLGTSDKLHNVSFCVAPGEVVGLAGRLGSGRTEIMRTVAGLDASSAGAVQVADGMVFSRRRDVRRRVSAGITLVPEDRKGEGVVLNQPIGDNLVLSCLSRVSRLGFIDHSAARALANASRASTEIRASSLGAPVSSLSGGNQQKVALARCVNAEAKVLLLDEPTRGVDIQSKHQIYDLIHSLAATGCAVVVVSSEYGELIQNCDRILVVDDGTIRGELDRDSGLDELLSAILTPSSTESEQVS